MPTHVSIKNLGSRPGINHKTIRSRGDRMLDFLGESSSELSVLCCDDVTIELLNSKYRNKDQPTDVLSFPMIDDYGDEAAGPEQPKLLGDIVISVPTAKRQAPVGRGGLLNEVTRLMAHGLLHLLGRTHETNEKLEAMEHETEQLIQAAAPQDRR